MSLILCGLAFSLLGTHLFSLRSTISCTMDLILRGKLSVSAATWVLYLVVKPLNTANLGTGQDAAVFWKYTIYILWLLRGTTVKNIKSAHNFCCLVPMWQFTCLNTTKIFSNVSDCVVTFKHSSSSFWPTVPKSFDRHSIDSSSLDFNKRYWM